MVERVVKAEEEVEKEVVVKVKVIQVEAMEEEISVGGMEEEGMVVAWAEREGRGEL